VIKPGDREPDVASGSMLREVAISRSTVGADVLWFGYVELGPGMVSAVHHHGEAESGIYLISGKARFVGGEALDDILDAEAGDFIWVPPMLPHVEINPSEGEKTLAVVVRSMQENIVFNLPTPEGWTPPLWAATAEPRWPPVSGRGRPSHRPSR
jgi:uncharacterized RmlC-like cupin family protein